MTEIILKHKFSLEEVKWEGFPIYEKDNSVYGFLTLTYDKRVLFFWVWGDSIEYDDVTSEYEIIIKPI